MRPESDVRRVFELWEQGLSKKAIARETGVGSCGLPAKINAPAYAYLFGQYLGDGCLSEARRNVFRLRIMMCDNYPNMRDECELAIHIVMPGRRVGHVQRVGCTEVYSHSKHWPCLFPQHGTGRKHERAIVLEPWQERIVYELHPEFFLRGLVHSDGCRCINRVKRNLESGPTYYTYPRYLFTNESADIRSFFIEACRRFDIECRYTKANTLSVARRELVGRLDSFIGPKT